jgi:hypothetical protein
MDLQRFVELHAKSILDLEVIASARRGGGRLFNIDILAVDKANKPVIVECKWDVVDQFTVKQLASYRLALLADWARFEERLTKVRDASVRVKKTDPILVTIGYRYDRALLTGDQPAVCLRYIYEDVKFTEDAFQEQKRQRVRLQRATQIDPPLARHPKVSKKLGTESKLKRLAPTLQKPFWTLHKKILTLDGAAVTYGKSVRYCWPSGLVAKAAIKKALIQWHVSGRTNRDSSTLNRVTDMRSASDAVAVFAILRDARD